MLKKISYLLFFVLSFLCASSYAAETITYYYHDALGSAVAATDESGNLLWREDYRPYGERIRNPTSTDNKLWFTGKPEEAQLGLQYFGARWYDPNLGRFTGIDPASVNGADIHSFNRYAYANNNPYMYVDPDGRTPAHALYYGTLSTIEVTTIVFGAVGATKALEAFGEKLYYSINGRPAYLNENVKEDGEGSTEEEIENSEGGPTAGKPVTSKEREKIINEEKEKNDGKLKCWRCGWESENEDDFHIGHKNKPRSKGGNKHPDNLACEGRSCNQSAGNRGKPRPGGDCKSKNSC